VPLFSYFIYLNEKLVVLPYLIVSIRIHIMTETTIRLWSVTVSR
jgi:hypothetical protein